MLEVSINKTASDVAAVLGESLALECQPEESPFPDLEHRVRIIAPGILANLILEADTALTTDAKEYSGEVTLDNDGTGILPLPDDFLKLSAIRMSGWGKTVTEITGTDNRKHAMQRSVWKGIRGTPQRPVVTMDFDSEGKRCLKLYSCEKTSKLSFCRYIPTPDSAGENSLVLPKALYGPLILKIADCFASITSD